MDNWRHFENLPREEEAAEFITYNDLEVLDETDPKCPDYNPLLVRFCREVMGTDITWHREGYMHDQILVAICRFLDANPDKYEKLWTFNL